jgi:CHASE2 domain-containing sensor protein
MLYPPLQGRPANPVALAAVITTWLHGWAGLGHLVTTITAAGVTAVLAVAAAVLLAGGFATIRRLTV